MRILHITDFHLDNIKDINEHLRLKFYKEYINELTNLIKSKVGKIDYIFSTGDFVNKYKFENFEHAKTILDYFSKSLGLDSDSISVCIGNHDFDQEADQKGNHKIARNEFINFRNEFSNNKIIKQNDTAILYKYDKIWCLTLDSTWGTGTLNKPRAISNEEIDEIINDFVVENVPDNDFLAILSHYPMIHFHRSMMYVEEKNWEEKHEWKDAYYIVERLFKIRHSSQNLYFFGDGHIPDFMSYNQYNHFFLSAMFGSGIGSKPDQVSREAKVIEVDVDNNQLSKIYTFHYEMRGYNDNPLIGDWKYTESQIRLDKSNKSFNLDTQKEIFLEETKISKKPILISTSIQDKIIKKIANEGLYSLDRYVTTNSKISLSWIYVNKLLSDLNILSQIINRTFTWYLEKFNKTIDKNKNEFAFFGIDFWGAIIASQVSVRTNINSHCIASKAGANHHTYIESVNYLKNKKQEFKNVNNIILFTDVIATGETVCRKKEKIEETIGKKDYNWYIVSVIADQEQDRGTNLDCFREIVTFCSEIRTPVLSNSQIPSEEILPPRIDLRSQDLTKPSP